MSFRKWQKLIAAKILKAVRARAAGPASIALGTFR
jgi:hypothetical protein